MYHAEACIEYFGASLRVIAAEQHRSFRRNVAAVNDSLAALVQFDQLEIWTPDLSFQSKCANHLINVLMMC